MRRNGDEPVYEFPPGFRMLAGDSERASFNSSDPSDQAIRLYLSRDRDGPGDFRFPELWLSRWIEGRGLFPALLGWSQQLA